jgi:hypothetical protein
MEVIGKNRRSADVREEYPSMLQRTTLAALQPLITQCELTSRYNRDTTSPLPMLVAMQLGTEKRAAKVKAHPIVGELEEVPSRGDKSPGSCRHQVEGVRRKRGTGRRPPWIQDKAGKFKLGGSMETLVSGKE